MVVMTWYFFPPSPFSTVLNMSEQTIGMMPLFTPYPTMEKLLPAPV